MKRMKVMEMLRQTGRTGRMVEDAVRKAAEGKDVIILAKPNEVSHIQRIVQVSFWTTRTGTSSASHGNVEVISHTPEMVRSYFRSVTSADSDSVFIDHAAISVDNVFIDHAVIEMEYHAILAHLHRFDEMLTINHEIFDLEPGKIMSALRQTSRVARMYEAIQRHVGVAKVYAVEGVRKVLDKNMHHDLSALPDSLVRGAIELAAEQDFNSTFIDPMDISSVFHSELKVLHKYDVFIRL